MALKKERPASAPYTEPPANGARFALFIRPEAVAKPHRLCRL